MALSVGSSWASMSRPSLSLQKHAEPILWRSIEGCKFRLLNNVRGSARRYQSVPVDVNAKLLKRKFIAFTTSGSQSPYDDLTDDVNGIGDMDDIDDMNDIDDVNAINDNDLLKGNSHISSVQSEREPGLTSLSGTPYEAGENIQVSGSGGESSNIFWFIGPTVLVASLVFPSFYLRRILLTIFEDSLFTDFLILFFTEALFYGGVAMYVLLIDHVNRNQDPATPNTYGQIKTNFGLRILSVATLVLSLIIPLVTMGMVWPWTGPAASATLAPYLVGLVVQFAFEQYARYRRSTASAIIPVVFQMGRIGDYYRFNYAHVYRLHQLNRATQLVTALSFSVRGVETTAQTVAINNSLGTLLNVLQLLGVICIWSLSSFLMRFLPASTTVPEP